MRTLLSLFLLLMSCSAMARKMVVCGVVVDTNGKFAKDVSVYIVSGEYRTKYLDSMITSEDGRFSLTSTDAKRQKVRIGKKSCIGVYLALKEHNTPDSVVSIKHLLDSIIIAAILHPLLRYPKQFEGGLLIDTPSEEEYYHLSLYHMYYSRSFGRKVWNVVRRPFS